MEVLNLLESHRIDDLVVVDDNNAPVGIVDSQDLTRVASCCQAMKTFDFPDVASMTLMPGSCARCSPCIIRLPSRFNNSQFSFHMAAANDLRKGMAIKYNGNTAIVLEVHHRTPGNLRAFVQAIIRYINTGKSADVRFGSTDKVELVDINRRSWNSVTRITTVPFHGSGNLRNR